MAETEILTGNNLAVKRWADKVFEEHRMETFFDTNGFIGTDSNNIIQEKTDLNAKSGDKITFPLSMALTGDGVSGDNSMENAEEVSTYYDCYVTINQLRNAIKIKGLMTEARVAFNMRTDSNNKLKKWLGEKKDAAIFTALATSLTKVKYAGSATTTATLTASDLMTLDLLSYVKAYCESTASPKIPPIKIKGKDYYVAILHPHAYYDVTVNDVKWAQAMREAQPRGEDNPLFRNASFTWDSVIAHKHNSIGTSTTWGASSNVAGATNLFLGSQAGVIAYGGYAVGGSDKARMRWVEKAFDYDNATGFCIGTIKGEAKAVFNSADFSVVGIRCARTNIAITTT